jgi:hypothetical protein
MRWLSSSGPTGLGSGAGKDDPDFVVYSRVADLPVSMSAAAFQTMSVRWMWSLYGVVLLDHPAYTPMVRRSKPRKQSSGRRLGSRYRSGRSPVFVWLKFKNPEAPAVKREAEEDWGR